MNYNRLQQGKKRCASKLNYQYKTVKEEYKPIMEKRGEHHNWNVKYPKDRYYPNRSGNKWPRRQFHVFKSVPYKHAIEDMECDYNE